MANSVEIGCESEDDVLPAKWGTFIGDGSTSASIEDTTGYTAAAVMASSGLTNSYCFISGSTMDSTFACSSYQGVANNPGSISFGNGRINCPENTFPFAIGVTYTYVLFNLGGHKTHTYFRLKSMCLCQIFRLCAKEVKEYGE